MKHLVIACNILKDKLLPFQINGTPFVFLEQSLHQTPKKMNEMLQEEMKKAEAWDGDTILLGYGLCCNGTVGIKSQNHSIVIPRVHDCITLFLGSCERYLEEHKKEPGTFYLTKEWIEEGKSPLGIYHGYCQRYGEETAEWAIREELKNYTRIVLIDVGNELLDVHREHARRNAEFFHLKYEELEGSFSFFKKMLQGSWEKDFITLNPGEEITQGLFLNL